MANYRLTPDAAEQFIKILEYGIDQFGPKQALKYQDELERSLQILADHPSLGRPATQVNKTLRRHEHGQYVILYRFESADILVLAIFHMATNWQLPTTD
ncbi:MAG: type II toxin-antitoxin system RelE/ParE family toxin [Devosia sp.]